uniref:Uncharacterized protein n=1 Tax=Aegilops tauschii subsp. strangulata TaxID=200361 RepID=A0A453BA71_AEGTS
MMSLKPSASAAAEGCRIASTPRSALTARSTPLQVINILGNFVRIWSVYSLYSHLSSTGDSIVGFIFSCFVPASVIFLILQKPWKGRPLPNSQIVPTVVNGGVLALYFVLWAKGLLACRPLVELVRGSLLQTGRLCHNLLTCQEYAGALLGVLSAALYGRKVNIWKKIGGLAAMLLAYYLLSNGWATRTNSPLYSFGSEPLEKATETTGMKEMVLPITAGILSALRRVLARRVSLKNQLKRRLHAITVASATCFLFPFAMWDTILVSAHWLCSYLLWFHTFSFDL